MSAPTSPTNLRQLPDLTHVRIWEVVGERDRRTRFCVSAVAWGAEWTGMGYTRAEALDDLFATLS